MNLKFMIEVEGTKRVRQPGRHEQFETNGSEPEVQCFSIDDYRKAIEAFDETCREEKEQLQRNRGDNWKFYKDSGILITFSICEDDEYEEQIEVLDLFEYTADEAKKENEFLEQDNHPWKY